MAMIEIVNKFEKVIYAVLMALFMVVIVVSVIDLALILYKSWGATRLYMLKTSVIITILGDFLLVLICIELLDTIKAY